MSGRATTTPDSATQVSPLVQSGLNELALSALTGWVYTLCRNEPELARRLGIKSTARIRQWHLDLAMLGTASVACGLANPGPPSRATRSLQIGAWTNAMAFLPLALKPDVDRHPAFMAAATASFAATTYGFCGLALEHRRRRREEREAAASR